MKSIVLSALLGTLLWAGGDVAPQRSNDGFYIGAELGLSSTKLISGGYNTIGRFPNTNQDTDIGAFGGINIGYIYNDWRIDLAYRAYSKTHYVTDSFRPPNPTFFYDSDLSVDLYMLSLYYDFGSFGPSNRYSFYGGAGIGSAKADLTTDDGVVNGSGTDTNFAWQLEAGLDYHYSESLHLYAGIRYVDMGTADIEIGLNGSGGGNFTAKLRSSEIFTGIRYRF